VTSALGTRASSELLERDAELTALAGVLDAARGGDGRLVTIAGATGIGKSSLLAAAASMASRREIGVLTARGNELERDVPFGIALQLIERPVRSLSDNARERVVAGAARLALPLLESGPGTNQPSLIHGLYWLTANLADVRPLVLLVDDAQWADRSSLTWLNYMAQRVGDLPVAIVVSYRIHEPGAESELLATLATAPQAERLRPAMLSAEAVATFVRRHHAEADDEFCDACLRATMGCPFLLREVLTAARERGLSPTAADAAAVTELVPNAVMRQVLERVDRLGEAAGGIARAAAVLGADAHLRHTATLDGVDMAVASDAADRLAWADVLRDGEPLEFPHPLVRSAVYADIPAARRARMHGYAARLLAEEGAAPDRIATHLLKTARAGSGWVVETLIAAAERALAGGEPRGAVEFLTRALEEPPALERRNEVLLSLATAEAAAGEPTAAMHYAEALEQLADPAARAEISIALARVLSAHGQSADAAAVLDNALADLGSGHERLALALQATWVAISRTDLTMRRHAAERVRLIVDAGNHEPTYEERMMLAQFASEEVFAGSPRDDVVRLARLAYGDGKLLELETSDGSSWVVALAALGWADELEEYERGFLAGLEDARRRGSVLGFATCSYGLNFSRYYSGRLGAAAADARQALDAERYGWREYLAACRAQLAWTLIERGELDDADAALVPIESDPTWQTHPAYAFVLEARGRIALARGDHGAALDSLLEAGTRIEQAQIPNPAILPWASYAALAALPADREHAQSLVADELEASRRFGAARALGISLRTAGIVAGGGDGVDLLRESLAVLDSSPALLERTRTLIALGAALRATAPRDARDPLREALDHAHRMGATALERQARGELIAAGGRPRRPVTTGVEALTPSERRVAAMAASGLTNREIAESLFVTVKAVQWHLGHVYRKLGISGRDGLPRDLATGDT
jgi:DNA-binding CsgD family transcriptional regulator/tetratricopeptide (TPR) repeat protein/ABC-type cobalamin/Fe3+-siderophores transport system ATPase subunit